MARRGGRDLAIGGMFTLGLIVLALAIMAVGGESRLFGKKARYLTLFSMAEGLRVGSPVKMAGVQIGAVSRIRLPTEPHEVGIEVELAIDPEYAPRVRADSKTALRILQYVSGEKFVAVTAGSPEHPALPDGAVIPQLESRELLEQSEAIADNLNDITLALKRILGPLERGEGLIGKMLTDPNFGEEGLESLRGTLDNVRAITAEVRSGKGTVGRLMYDEQLASRLDMLGKTIEDLSAVVDVVRRHEATVGQLLDENGPLQQGVRDLSAAAASFKEVGRGIQAHEGFLGRLLSEEDCMARMSGDLCSSMRGFAGLVEKIDSGQGTLGALINERKLHDSMEDVVAGANDSALVRWVLRRYRKKGVKFQQSQQQQEQTERGPAPVPSP